MARLMQFPVLVAATLRPSFSLHLVVEASTLLFLCSAALPAGLRSVSPPSLR